MRHAERIAINRTVAGVHFPVDSAAGMVLGRALAEFYLKRAGVGQARKRVYDGRMPDGGFSDPTADLPANAGDFDYETFLADNGELAPVTPSKLLPEIWGRARAEWPAEPSCGGA